MNRLLRLLTALACLAGLALSYGCAGHDAAPLRDLHPKPATFRFTVTTNVLMNYGGNLDEQEVNRNVPPAQEAIEAMVAKGYKYVPDGPSRYVIHADMLCYDPQMVSTVHEQDEALDMLEPVAPDMFTQDWDRAVMQETWYQYPNKKGPDFCVGKVFLTVTLGDGDDEGKVFQGGVYTPKCAYANDCAYRSCSQALDQKLMQMVQKLF